MKKTYVERFVEDSGNRRLLLQESAIYEVTAKIEKAMSEMGVSRTQLAKLLGKTKGWVTQLLDGESNKTIRTVADVFAVLDQEYISDYKPFRVSNAPSLEINIEVLNSVSYGPTATHVIPSREIRFTSMNSEIVTSEAA